MTDESPAYSRAEGKARRQRLAEAESEILRERAEAERVKALARAKTDAGRKR